MKGIRSRWLLTIWLFMLLAGCAGNGLDEPGTEELMQEQQPDSSESAQTESAEAKRGADTPLEQDTTIDYRAWTESARLEADVDGDGSEETVELSLAERHGFMLKVGTAIIKVEDAENTDGELAVVEFKPGMKLITVPESGPSSDDATWFLAYRNGEIVNLGRLQGKGERLQIPGDGTITSHSVRGQILHTWFHDQTYRLTEADEWEAVPQEMFNMNTPVKALIEITLQKSSSDTTAAFTLKPGDEAIIKASDDIAWCVVTKDGLEGWFAVDDYYMIRGLNRQADQVFEGLSFAD